MANSSVGNKNISLPTCDFFNAVNSSIGQVLVITTYTFQFFVSVIGNSLVIAVFHKRLYQLRTPVDYFIVNMAVSDLLVPIFVIPRRVKELVMGYGPWLVGGAFGDILCKVVNLADEISVTVSSQSMVFIAVERFWAIVYPLKKPIISLKTTPRFIGFTWIFSIVFYSYYFFAYKLAMKHKTLSCLYGIPELFEAPEALWKVDRIALLVVFVVLPFILLTIFYTAILVTLHRQKTAGIRISSEAQRRRSKTNQRITIMLVVVVVFFFIAWTPYYLYFFKHFLSLGEQWSCEAKSILYVTTKYLNYVFTYANPLIYYIFNKSYHKGFHELLSCPSFSFCCCGQNRRRPRPVLPLDRQPNVQCISVYHINETQ